MLVNSAGLAGGDSIDAPDEAFFEAVVQSNLTGSWRCCAAALPMMTRGGRIVCVSSVLGLKAVPDQIAYTAAKHGVIGLMKSLALALAPRGITVNAVCPGWVETDMARSRFAELASWETNWEPLQLPAASVEGGRVNPWRQAAAVLRSFAWLEGTPEPFGLGSAVDPQAVESWNRCVDAVAALPLIHILRCRRSYACRFLDAPTCFKT